MPSKIAKPKTAGISDEAVKAKTGSAWAQWCTALDKAGARKMPHKEIAKLIGERFDVAPWWCQMVTVGYEQTRGLRKLHQTPKGFSISVSRTIAVPVDVLYGAWKTARSRSRWLNATGLKVRKATASKSMRIMWIDAKSNVDVHFYAKSDVKSQVTVQHNKLAREGDVPRMKTLWSEALDKPKATMQASAAGGPIPPPATSGILGTSMA